MTRDDVLTDIEMLRLAIKLEEDCEIRDKLEIELQNAEDLLNSNEYLEKK